MTSSPEPVEEIERVIERSADADDVLREVVALLNERFDRWVGIYLVEGGDLVLGPSAGPEPRERHGFIVPIVYDGHSVGEIHVDADTADHAERAFLGRVAVLVSPHCLVGWDTGGERWSP